MIILFNVDIFCFYFNEKGRKVNNLLKSKCTENDLGYIENTNTKVHKHLNGTVALANNFLDVINI